MGKTRSTTRSTRRNGAAANGGDLSQQIGRILLESLLRAADEPTDIVGLMVERSATSVAPARLAAMQSTDPALRDGLVTLYENCLQTYRERVRPQDTALGRDDAGAALAFFVASNLNALHGVDVTPEVLQRLERQLIGLARLISTWESASIGARQVYFEQTAILGMLVAAMAERARNEDGASLDRVRATARAYMRQLFALDPDLVTLDGRGLALRSTQNESRHATA